MKFKAIHATALVVLGVYFAISKVIYLRTAVSPDPFVYFFIPFVYSSVSVIVFMYMFSHEDFFTFAKDIEKKEMKREEKLLNHFNHGGKLTTTLLVTAFAGPIFSALTARLLLHNYEHKYYFLIFANVFATLWGVATTKGMVVLLFS